ncbi:phosphate ABC transporter substrate-binding protein PstS [Enemella sp. A6]|uniref:phosphate ABC transporter substrate-binding protein PstS n=1 Tax=Enemella sp. A6 TaxID=3440152 RepID=UPI003EBE31EA
MKFSRVGAAIALTTALGLGLSACASNNPGTGGDEGGNGGGGGEQQLTGTLSGGGASSQESAMLAWIDGFKSEQSGMEVLYDVVGSGTGREGFVAGKYTFAGSDAAMKQEDGAKAEQCGDSGVINIPAYISPVALAYNLPDVKAENIKMDAETIAAIFTGKINKWNDPKIAEQNEGVDLPDLAITVVVRGDSSGTTENFTSYLEANAADTWTYGEVEDWPTDLKAESAQQTGGVVGLTKQTEGAITYADASAVEGLGTVAVGVGGEYVPYSSDAASKAVETGKRTGEGNDMAVELDRTTEEPGVYPIVLVSYHIYCQKYADQETADMVKAFAKYMVSADGQKTAEGSAGNAPLSEKLSGEATEAIDSIGVQ